MELVYPIQNFKLLEWRGQLAGVGLTQLTPAYNLSEIRGYKVLIKSLEIFFYTQNGGNYNFIENLGAGDDFQTKSSAEFGFSPLASDYYSGGYFAELTAGGSLVKIGSQIAYLPAQKTKFKNLNWLVNSPVTELFTFKIQADLKAEDLDPGYTAEQTPFCKVVCEAYIFQGANSKTAEPFQILR